MIDNEMRTKIENIYLRIVYDVFADVLRKRTINDSMQQIVELTDQVLTRFNSEFIRSKIAIEIEESDNNNNAETVEELLDLCNRIKKVEIEKLRKTFEESEVS